MEVSCENCNANKDSIITHSHERENMIQCIFDMEEIMSSSSGVDVDVLISSIKIADRSVEKLGIFYDETLAAAAYYLGISYGDFPRSLRSICSLTQRKIGDIRQLIRKIIQSGACYLPICHLTYDIRDELEKMSEEEIIEFVRKICVGRFYDLPLDRILSILQNA